MSLFGIFGGDKSSSSSDTSTHVTTTTTVRDIGLTGQNAVDTVGLLQASAVEQARIAAQKDIAIAQQDTTKLGMFTASLDNLINTGSHFIDVANQQGDSLLSGVFQTSQSILQATKDLTEVGASSLSASQEGLKTVAETSSSNLSKAFDIVKTQQDAGSSNLVIMYIVLAGIGGYVLIKSGVLK